MNKSDLLWVVWNNSREGKKYIIAKLFKNKKFYFQYCEDYNIAKEKGCTGIFSFPEEDIIYESKTLFPAFLTRLPSRNREDIREILANYELSEYDAFELLKKTRGKVMTDNFEFVNDSVKEKIILEERNDKKQDRIR